ncbi:uncharacterized protein LOC5564837 isoform X1 [Aedes aegypti]|uniref:Uncharacterized protein n=1 Tax=Aedes aegypti TaxID=7159 RepID=A0A1S4G6K4_AEDAE|nr:uncharacterized protein LOC5564837 isoform X1 [Aedes aegypti]
MSKKPKKRKVRQYTRESLFKAIDAVDQGMSLFKAAATFGVPRTTLSSYYEDRNRQGKTGPTLTFTDAEEQLMVEWTRDVYQKGLFCRASELLEAARCILDDCPRTGKQKARNLSTSWVRAFYKRHPQVPTYLRVDMEESPELPQQKCFETVFQHLDCLDIFNDPSRVFKYNEIKFGLCSNFYNYIAGDNASSKSELITTGVITSASGRLAFPSIIYPHDGTIPLELAATVPLFYGYGSSPKGTSTTTTFYNYVTKVFYKYLMLNKMPIPVVLFVDGTRPNVSFRLWQACRSLGIILVAFNPDESFNFNNKYFPSKTLLTTHIVEKLRDALAQWRESNGNRISEMHFAELLQPVVHNLIPTDLIKSDWAKFTFYQWIQKRRSQVEDIEFVSANPAASKKKSSTANDKASSGKSPVAVEEKPS